MGDFDLYDDDELDYEISSNEYEVERLREEIAGIERSLSEYKQEKNRRAELKRQKEAKSWYDQQQLEKRLEMFGGDDGNVTDRTT